MQHLCRRILSDAHSANILVDYNYNFHIIDTNYISIENLDKAYPIYMLTYRTDMYEYFLKKYNLKDKNKEFEQFRKDYFQGELVKEWTKKAKEINKDLYKIYFTDYAFGQAEE